MTTGNTSDDRKEFEAVMREKYGNFIGLKRSELIGEYLNPQVMYRWEGWQLRSAQPSPDAAQQEPRPNGMDIFNPLSLREAKAQGVCRICRVDDKAYPGNPFVYHFGIEYAHRKCLDACSPEQPAPPAPQSPAKDEAGEAKLALFEACLRAVVQGMIDPRVQPTGAAGADDAHDFLLTPDAQFFGADNNGAISVHVGIGDGGFSLGGDKDALRSLANMILHTVDDDCPQCRAEVAAAKQQAQGEQETTEQEVMALVKRMPLADDSAVILRNAHDRKAFFHKILRESGKRLIPADQSGSAQVGGNITLGVGDGSGNLFVHGDYDSIKRVQSMIFELEELRSGIDRAVASIETPPEVKGRVMSKMFWWGVYALCDALATEKAKGQSTQAMAEGRDEVAPERPLVAIPR